MTTAGPSPLCLLRVDATGALRGRVQPYISATVISCHSSALGTQHGNFSCGQLESGKATRLFVLQCFPGLLDETVTFGGWHLGIGCCSP